jgi:hypothetical protein
VFADEGIKKQSDESRAAFCFHGLILYENLAVQHEIPSYDATHCGNFDNQQRYFRAGKNRYHCGRKNLIE